MRKKSRRLLFSTLTLAAIILAIGYVKRPQPVSVLIAAGEKGRVEATVTNTRAGTVESCRRARLAPPVGGQVARLLVEKGQRVEAGQPLLELWNRDLAAQLELAKSQLKATAARSKEACLQADIAKREYRRIAKLYQQHLTSEEALDRTQTEAEIRAASCEAARAGNRVSADQVALAEAQLERTWLTAPFAGVVAEINGEPGEFVTPSPPGIPTPPAVDLFDPECLYVAAPIDEVDAPAVELRMPARITLDAFAEQAFDGRVQRIAPYVLDIEKQARTVAVEVFFIAPEEVNKLLPGYSADVEIILDVSEQILRIPTEAVLEDNRVLVYNPTDKRLEQRGIETGLSNWRYTEVISGLAEQEQVVTSIERPGVEDGAYAIPEVEQGEP